MLHTLHTHVRRRSLLAVGALTVALTACGGGDDSTVATGPEGGASSEAAAFNDADVTFIREMTPHHNGALEMAKLAADRAENPKVKDLAARIEKAQDPEIQQMAALAKQWGVALDTGATSMPGHSMSGGMSMGGDGAAKLEPLKGAAFDKAFLEEMIPHHESAVQMSQQELKAGRSEEAKKLAQAIIDGQTAEIAEMKALLQTL